MRACCQTQAGICDWNAALAHKSELHADHTWKHAQGFWLAAWLMRGWDFKVWLLISEPWNGWSDDTSPATLLQLWQTEVCEWALRYYTCVSPWQISSREETGQVKFGVDPTPSLSPHLGCIGHFAEHLFFNLCMWTDLLTALRVVLLSADFDYKYFKN